MKLIKVYLGCALPRLCGAMTMRLFTEKPSCPLLFFSKTKLGVDKNRTVGDMANQQVSSVRCGVVWKTIRDACLRKNCGEKILGSVWE